MTVSELIKALEAEDPKAVVVVAVGCANDTVFSDDIGDVTVSNEGDHKVTLSGYASDLKMGLEYED